MVWSGRGAGGGEGSVVEPRCIGFRYGNGKVSGEDKEDAIWSSRAPAEERAGGDPPPMPTGVAATPSSPFLNCCPKEMIFLVCRSSRTNEHYQNAAVEKWAGWAGSAARKCIGRGPRGGGTC
jgi:hypothetical protein